MDEVTSPGVDLDRLDIAGAIYKTHEARSGAGRTYLGGSVIGTPCSRALWYQFTGAQDAKYPGRMLRLFETGHREEDRLITELRKAGYSVLDRVNGQQIAFSTLGGHYRGSADGIIEIGQTLLLETKTHNKASFAALQKHGVKKHKPVHYDQMQVYMQQFDLLAGIYLAVNKDDESIYSEVVVADKAIGDALLEKARTIITSPAPPERISEDPSSFACKFCDYKDICHQAVMPRKDCRTCFASSADLSGTDGDWSCAKWKASVPNGHVRDACPSHVFLPIFFRDSIVLDAGTNESPWLHMKHEPSGREFVHGPSETAPALEGVPVYGSDELAGQPAARYYDPVRADLTLTFGPLLEAEVPF
jgi:hypothetical protein